MTTNESNGQDKTILQEIIENGLEIQPIFDEEDIEKLAEWHVFNHKTGGLWHTHAMLPIAIEMAIEDGDGDE